MNRINFKKWAFHFTIWIMIINIITIYNIINYTNFPGVADNMGLRLFLLGILSTILLLLSIAFIIISSIKKEERNYEYWTSVIGVFLFGILPIIIDLF